MTEIPIVQCFDHDYVLPAGVAFQSMLEYAKAPETIYVLHVIGTGLTDADKDLLSGIVAKFPQAQLVFHNPSELDIPKYTGSGNLSQDVFYKMTPPLLFPEYKKVVVADLDVVYAGDIAEMYNGLSEEEDVYMLGVEDIGYAAMRETGILKEYGAPRFFKRYYRQMSKEERSKLVLNTGFFCMNLELCRKNRLTERCIQFAKDNFDRLVLLDQDILNICCAPRIKKAPSRFMAFAEYEPVYRNLTPEQLYGNPSWEEMYANPLMIHYTSGIKPWKYPQSACSRLWFEACMRAGLFDEWRKWYANFMMPQTRTMTGKRLVNAAIPLGKGKTLHIQIHKERK